MLHQQPQSFRARWVFPVDQPPIHNGVVETYAGKISQVRAYQNGEAVIDLGEVALLPGLVNAHTHLEFSGISLPLGNVGLDFPSWIRKVIAYRRERETESPADGSWRTAEIEAGLHQSQIAAVSLLGEIVTIPCPLAAYRACGQPITLFLELLGMLPERMEALWQIAQAHIAQQASLPAHCRVGLSPHAPYTVHPELLRRVCQLSQEIAFPVAMHLAESIGEMELLQSGSGGLATLLAELNALPHGVLPRGVRPLDYLEMLAVASRSLIIHGNFLAADEITYLGERSERMSVVYCPRTHAYFCGGDYPLAKMLAANVNVCLGTDSRASNPDLRLWAEMKFVAKRHPQVTLAGVLHIGTLSGAEALGLAADFGSITPGKQAHFALIPITSNRASEPRYLRLHLLLRRRCHLKNQ